MRFAILAASVALAACGGSATAPAKAPAPQKDTARVASQPKAKSPPKAPQKAIKLVSLFQTGESDEPAANLPPGIMIASRDARMAQVPVQPAELNLGSLPLAEVPEPLKHESAPKALPNAAPSNAIRIEKVARSRNSAVYIVLKAKMGRLQIGSINPQLNAGDRVYRTCGEEYYTRPMLTPARWETMTVDAQGKAEYRVVDAWFDQKSCDAAVVSTTVVRPQPVLGGLMYAFQTKCDKCKSGHTVTFLAPSIHQLAASGVGGKAHASHGNALSLITLPIRKGGAASFAGTIHVHNLAQWLQAMKQEAPKADVSIGVEISQAVADEGPHAIAYATFIKH